MQKPAKILVLDNNDSFTYNLVELIKQVNKAEPIVVEHTYQGEFPKVDGVIFSPGPGLPHQKPLMKKAMRQYLDKVPILGICLGHQFIAEYFGEELMNLGQPLHGIEVEIDQLKEDIVFKDVDFPFKAALYHSWAMKPNYNSQLVILAHYKQIPMALKHKSSNVYGFQFHPESFLTIVGKTLLKNWIHLIVNQKSGSDLNVDFHMTD